jgi:hypothetical protein
MISLLPLNTSGNAGYELVPLNAVAGKDRPIPSAWLSETATSVNEGFLSYVRPLIGNLLEYHSPFRFSLDTYGVS